MSRNWPPQVSHSPLAGETQRGSIVETDFRYDVFLSHSAQDKDAVREIANRLKSDGVRVWFDEWEIRAGDSIPAKI